jgi:UrcA family protein
MLKSRFPSIVAIGATFPLVASALAAIPQPATAAPVEEVRTVSYLDLDLTRETGVRSLERRVAGAVRKVCGDGPPVTLAERQAHWACAETASADARAQIERAVELALLQRGQVLTTAHR